MDDIETLARLFEKFPGIGPRQAKRFVYFLLRADGGYRADLIQRISSLSKGVARCDLCGRFMAASLTRSCAVCGNGERNKAQVMVVLKDADIESFESANVYQGTYLVLGTLAQLTQDALPSTLQSILARRFHTSSGVQEIILALPVTTDGEHTSELVKQALKTVVADTVSVSMLARGLSTGSELEYADPQTLRNAFTLRKNN
jgi:recombination protein RecR